MIKMPICELGKKLGITDLIDSIDYRKGDKNNIGDSPDDYVEIRFVDEYKVIILEHDGVKEIMTRHKLDEIKDGKHAQCLKCSYFGCLCGYDSEKL